MLENTRYQTALRANAQYAHVLRRIMHDEVVQDTDALGLFMAEQYRTQLILEKLGVTPDIPPANVATVGKLHERNDYYFRPDQLFSIEVVGMPDTGKSTLIKRFLAEMSISGNRKKFVHLPESAQKVKEKFPRERQEDPFSYALMVNEMTIWNYSQLFLDFPDEANIILAERGAIDRRVFRRALFDRGFVHRSFIEDDPNQIYSYENPWVVYGLVVIFMARPAVAFSRNRNHSMSIDELNSLYEQYWRLHLDLLSGEIFHKNHIVIDAENSLEDTYKLFKASIKRTLEAGLEI